ncbi:TlpA family protein disulfide reductase [Hymenobacter sp. J193]|uniref:TlpA family protein disulfide reductase n=1 Tax=Hymenobacter sp. J193 TaxID=2898429 RepID=UPI002150AB8F|nr:TlpA family protein disulfide reductase [Hymenobacter sp. J193]MCR5889965.1 TlpA family protein disulfide reductase [Hymenobacter sp. J193]
MLRLSFLIMAVVLLLAQPGRAQQVAVIKLPELQRRLSLPNDTTYVVNFWATWCAPCIKELPYFDQLTATYAGQKVKVLLVSMDYASQLDKKVKPFVLKRGLKSEVVLLNETNPNTYLAQIDPTWSGALPFTLLLNNARQRRATFEQEFTAEELKKHLQAFIK